MENNISTNCVYGGLGLSSSAKEFMKSIKIDTNLSEYIKDLLDKFIRNKPYGIIMAYNIICAEEERDIKNLDTKFILTKMIFRCIADDYNGISYKDFYRVFSDPFVIFEYYDGIESYEYEFFHIYNPSSTAFTSSLNIRKKSFNLDTNNIKSIGPELVVDPIHNKSSIDRAKFKFNTIDISKLKHKLNLLIELESE